MVEKDSAFPGEMFSVQNESDQLSNKIISVLDHDSLRTERHIQTICKMVTKHQIGKGEI